MKYFPLAREIFKFSLPIIGARILNNINGFVAMLMIAHLGHQQLAAGALVTSLQIMFFVTSWSILFSVSVEVARSFGADQFKEVGVITRQGLLLGTIIGILLMILFLFIKPILLYFGQPKPLVALTQQYFYALSWGVLPSMWIVCLSQTLTGIGRPHLALNWTFINMPISIILGYLLIFGKFGFPKLGMAGMGYATSITYIVAFIAISAYLAFNKYFSRYQFFSLKEKGGWKHFKDILQMGWPIGLQYGVELLAFSISTLFVGWLGEVALGAQQIVTQISLMALMVPVGMSLSNAALIGQAMGKKEFMRVKNIGYVSVIMGVIFSVAMAIIYCLFPNFIISLYLNVKSFQYSQTVELAKWLLIVVAISQIPDTIRNVITGALRGFRDTRAPMILGTIACLISLPVGYLFGFIFHWGVIGIRAGFIFGFLFGAVALMLRFQRKSSELLSRS